MRRGITGKARRVPATVAAIAFILFAVSDAVEIATGAWWRPWWLFAWKATCVVILVGILVKSVRRKGQALANRIKRSMTVHNASPNNPRAAKFGIPAESP